LGLAKISRFLFYPEAAKCSLKQKELFLIENCIISKDEQVRIIAQKG
jgi:hypothetical protein